ncbi:MAG TPA: methionyl-tRNA formyltransferase [Flavitalea sp.]|nr:methionyl-tRNA formyltransferase [Flavitalea sp.]
MMNAIDPAFPRIVFMGTPAFAVASLDALVTEGFNVVGVVTAPDKPAGRGMKLNESAVKKYAMEKGLRILQPEKLKNPAFIETLKELKADLQAVVAFRMLPEIVWHMPPLGTINVHASLLPDYRGAAPINWAIINGEKETGVTTFKLAHEIDTGNILLQRRVAIGETETAGELHDKLMIAGASLLTETIRGIVDGSIHEQPQEEIIRKNRLAGDHDTSAAPPHAPKIFTETCDINWNKKVSEIYDLVRGLSPFPCAFTRLEGKIIKIYTAAKEPAAGPLTAGAVYTDKKSYLKFACSDGYLHVKEIQMEGKKRMSIEEFLRGYRFSSL